MQEFSLLIVDWYRQNARKLPWRETDNPYFIWLSEVILQQTRVDQGMNYYLKFVSNYPTIHDLAQATEDQVLNDWQGLGYYSRARNLHVAARYVSEELNGIFPSTFDEIIKLKGVGNYTGAAIASFAFGERKAVVDGNVYRVLSRIFNEDIPIDTGKGQRLFQGLADDFLGGNDPAEHNQAMMEFGAMMCSPKPNCESCPLQSKCLAFENDTIKERPVKKGKTKVRNRFFHYGVYITNDETYIEKRVSKDIWQNMYQFPLIETDDENTPSEFLHSFHKSTVIKHVLSHQRIYAQFYHLDAEPIVQSDNSFKIAKSSIQDYPLPRIIDRYLEDISEW